MMDLETTARGSSRAVEDHLDAMRMRGLRPATIYLRQRVLTLLEERLGHELATATPGELQEWERSLRHLTDSARRTYIIQVREYFKWALANDIVTEDPSRRLVTPRIQRRLPRPIREDDLKLALLSAPARVRPMLLLAGWAGLRAREIALLRREDILDHVHPRMLIVADGKGGKQRMVPLADVVWDAMVEHGLPATGYVFPRHDGQRGANQPYRVSHMANRHLHSFGIPDTLHSLRHRFGTRLYAVSQDLRMVQEAMGHSSPTTTAGYVAYSQTQATEAVARLETYALSSAERQPESEPPAGEEASFTHRARVRCRLKQRRH